MWKQIMSMEKAEEMGYETDPATSLEMLLDVNEGGMMDYLLWLREDWARYTGEFSIYIGYLVDKAIEFSHGS